MIIRGDQKLGDGSFLYGRYAYNDGARKNPNLNPNWYRPPEESRPIRQRPLFEDAINPRLLMDITAGYSRFSAE